MRPVRAVVDTNVVLSAARNNGIPRQVMRMWRDGDVILCVSPPIVEEYLGVLARRGFPESLAEMERAIGARRHCEMAKALPSLRVVSDPDDDKFVECAVALSAEFIVSGDRALRKLRRHGGVEILSPAEFIAAVGGPRAEH